MFVDRIVIFVFLFVLGGVLFVTANLKRNKKERNEEYKESEIKRAFFWLGGPR